MENITKLSREVNLRVYDIKGSEFNRSAMEDNRLKVVDESLRRFTLKDKDFKVLEKKIRVNPTQAEQLKNIAKKDIQFLGSLGFIDYSFIVIKRQGQENFNKNQFSQIKSNQEESIIYNFGIIDYLQSWTLKRKAQRALKTLITNEEVTADSPTNYANRLCEFLNAII